VSPVLATPTPLLPNQRYRDTDNPGGNSYPSAHADQDDATPRSQATKTPGSLKATSSSYVGRRRRDTRGVACRRPASASTVPAAEGATGRARRRAVLIRLYRILRRSSPVPAAGDGTGAPVVPVVACGIRNTLGGAEVGEGEGLPRRHVRQLRLTQSCMRHIFRA
jgi:hypothetical protein